MSKEVVQQYEVEVIIPDEILKENKAIASGYNKSKKVFSFSLDNNIPKEVADEINALFKSEGVGANQLVIFNPLFEAVNKLQDLKDLKYDPEIKDEALKEISDKFQTEHISLDLETNEYLWDLKQEVIDKFKDKEGKLEKINADIEKAIDKARTNQHKASHQVYKDAKKITGSFNTALRDAKKKLKDPFVQTGKKIDAVYNVFNNESVNAKNALDKNFEACLAKEEQIKKDAQAKKDAAKNAQIEALSEENKKQAELLSNQQKETQKAQTENQYIYGIVGKISQEVAGNAQNLNKEGLESKRKELENHTYESLTSHMDMTVFNEDEEIKFRQELEDKKVYWFGIIDREIGIRNERAESAKKSAQMEVLQKQTPSFPEDDNSTPFEISNQGPSLEPENRLNNDDERYKYIVDKIENFKNYGLTLLEEIETIGIQDEFYLKKLGIIKEQSLPQINNWNEKLHTWAQGQYDKYIEYKKNNS